MLRHESSSSSADDRRVIAAEFRTEPRRFERAITLARIGGAVASLVVAPLLPNLGFGYVLLLSTYLVVWGVGLHLLSERASTAADQDRISMASFVGDCVVLFLAMLTLTPDPNWTLFPVMGVLFIITAAFRLGGVGALAATVILSTEFVALALWREQSLGLALHLPYLAFVLVMYCMTALLTSGMLREIGALRNERTVLIRDADSMRRAERDRGELLERERSARADAEVATARLEALQRITDVALAHTSLEEMLPEMLQRILPVFAADAIVALVPSSTSDSYVVRAGVGVVPLTRAALRIRGGDCERAIQSRRAVAIGDRSAAEIEAIVNTRVEASAVAPLVANGQHSGLLYVGRGETQPFAPDELALLRLIADRVAGALERATLFDSERRARSAAEAAEGRMRLLLHAGDALVTPNIGERLGAIARIAVPDLADFCAIDLLEENGDLERVALAAVDVEMERDNWALASRERREPTSTHPIWDVLRTGEPIVWEDLDPPRLNRLAWNPRHLRMMLERGVHSWMAVPLRTDRIRGALVFVNARSERRFDADDVATARELALRVAAALSRG